MPRGLGRLQRELISVLRHHKSEPPEQGFGFHPQLIRSVRRSLRKLVDADAVLAVGRGGPRDPHRYCINPMLIAAWGDQAEMAAWGDDAEWAAWVTVDAKRRGTE